MTETLRSCPICGNTRAAAHAPFCSQRCRDRDLARWFGDVYAVPGRPAPPEALERELADPRES
ncbi:MAG: DNA gyrase inhibitor YacG [Qipengyuania sp.]|nr:DNA gyrase inhibitor YacG [Qipengyuania sp.]